MPQRYARVQIWLHWVIAALVGLEYATSELIEEGGAFLAGLHVWPGVAILVLMPIRLVLRLALGTPEPPESEHPFLRRLAVWTHWAFYALLILIPAGALAARYGVWKGGQLLHDAGEPVFFILFWLHLGAALVHHFIFRTDVLIRMVPILERR